MAIQRIRAVNEIPSHLLEEARALAAHFHFGSQGIVGTWNKLEAAVYKVLEYGYYLRAFDTEMSYAAKALELLGDKMPIHVPISYPMGKMTLNKKMHDLQYIADVGVKDCCICLDYQAIFSRSYERIEEEVKAMQGEFGRHFDVMAFVIPATLMSDSEIIEVCRAIDSGGGLTVKVNPGAKLGVSYEEVELIRRVFKDRFDIHPSGNIRKWEDVKHYLNLGCTTIHSITMFEILDEYINLRLHEGEEAIW